MTKKANILDKNKDLLERMKTEHWDIEYDHFSDTFFVSGKFPVDSYFMVFRKEKMMLRVDSKLRVHGIALPNFKKLAKQHKELRYIKRRLLIVRFYSYINRKRQAKKAQNDFYGSFVNFSTGELIYS